MSILQVEPALPCPMRPDTARRGAVPFVGHNGRRADVVLTSAEGVRIIVEVKYSNGKGMGYGFDVARAGNWLAVELDVARWKDDATLLPDFSRPGMLQGVLNQVTWLNPGTPSLMEWMPYTQIWHKNEHDVPGNRDAREGHKY